MQDTPATHRLEFADDLGTETKLRLEAVSRHRSMRLRTDRDRQMLVAARRSALRRVEAIADATAAHGGMIA